MMRFRRVYRAGLTTILVGLVLLLGAVAASAQEGGGFYPPEPSGQTQVLPDVQVKTPQPAVNSGSLSATGAETMPWLFAGVGLVVIGGLAVYATRKRYTKAG